MKKILFALTILSLIACANPAGDRVKIAKKGKLAPQISFSKVISGDMSAIKGWEDFKGKAVVLEFWSTKCEPCVANIPHFNKLIEKFKDKPVVFLSITNEPADMARQFMKTHEMKGIVVAEADAEISKKFRVLGIPYTVLINRKGEVAAFTYPSRVTEKTIEDLISGAALPSSEPGTKISALTNKDAISFFSINVSSGAPSLSYGDSMFEVNALSLSYIIPLIMDNTHGVEYKDVPKALLSQKYRLSASIKSIKGTDDKQRLRDFIVAGINGALPLKIRVSKRNKKVYLLKKRGELKSGLVKVPVRFSISKNTGFSDEEMSIEGKGLLIIDLAEVLEEWLEVPVLDETGLIGRYNYKFRTEVFDIKSINKALTEELGLKLVKSRRKVDITEVQGFKFPVKK